MGNLHRIVSKGLFTWREEDPRRRNNFSLGLRTKISVRVMPKETRFEKELKMAGDKTENAIWAFQFFLLVLISIFQQNYHNNRLVLTLNEMVGLYCHD